MAYGCARNGRGGPAVGIGAATEQADDADEPPGGARLGAHWQDGGVALCARAQNRRAHRLAAHPRCWTARTNEETRVVVLFGHLRAYRPLTCATNGLPGARNCRGRRDPTLGQHPRGRVLRRLRGVALGGTACLKASDGASRLTGLDWACARGLLGSSATSSSPFPLPPVARRAVGGSALDLLPRGRVSAGLVRGLAPDTLEVPPPAVRETYGFSVRRGARQAVATLKLLTSRDRLSHCGQAGRAGAGSNPT